MSVWFAIPSKRPAAEANICLDRWKQMGYKLALWRDPGDEPIACDLMLSGEYPGYAQAVNALCKEVLERDADCDWVVTGGDDTLPDPNHSPEEIAEQCERHFSPEVLPHWKKHTMPGTTFGVMQPTGDGHGIDTICGSPWIGREFCLRVNGGQGPFWPEYRHCFLDNELQDVAKRLGVLWQRPDLTHKHNNWMWTTKVKPSFLQEAYSKEHWNRYKALYERRKAAGFPGHEPIALEVAA